MNITSKTGTLQANLEHNKICTLQLKLEHYIEVKHKPIRYNFNVIQAALDQCLILFISEQGDQTNL
jgi:hypothetical protein